jgi:hypothetical protein
MLVSTPEGVKTPSTRSTQRRQREERFMKIHHKGTKDTTLFSAPEGVRAQRREEKV